jgi:Protein of unknown function (DUF3305)
MNRPQMNVAVVMEREAAPNRWEDWRYRVVDVMADTGDFGTAPRLLRDDGKFSQTLHPGFTATLFADEAEGYWMNISAERPAWFVRWRVDEGDASQVVVEAVTLSYYEAGRWMNGPEPVETVPVPADVLQWLTAFTQEHFKPEPKQRHRPASFVKPEDRR